MKKLSLDTLKKRTEAVASEDLLATISGGTENACHDDRKPNTGLKQEDREVAIDNTRVKKPIVRIPETK